MVEREANPVETRNLCLSSDEEKERWVLQVALIMRFPSRQAAAEALVETALELHGRIDALHSNAGVWRQGKVTDFTLEDWNAVMGVNVMVIRSI